MSLRLTSILIGPNPPGHKKKGTWIQNPQVPIFFLWRARQDSNLRPTDS